jgi:energy-coupling factor transport system permease protein
VAGTTKSEKLEIRPGGGSVRISLDPRTKILALILINISAFSLSGVYFEWVNMALIILLSLLFGLYGNCVKYAVAYTTAMLFVHIAAELENPALAALSIIVLLIRRFLPMLMFGSFLINTTKVSEMVNALERMKLPKSAVITLAVALRFIPTAREEFHHIGDAMKLRGKGVTVRNMLTRPLATIEHTLVPMMLRSATIAEELSAAAVTRGIDGAHTRTSLYLLRFGILDALCVLLFGSVAGFSLCAKWRFFA